MRSVVIPLGREVYPPLSITLVKREFNDRMVFIFWSKLHEAGVPAGSLIGKSKLPKAHKIDFCGLFAL
jgi:hypothetical protein